ncbi:aspartate aminotransferase family protein [Streptomyces sp. MP131-18]|uniref:class-III pyridoxal-phosphate-dependent aminotransferase n=1 Tax=Streptomyces sp. MP131-18 TaxID=1857892 RepID=UPI00097C2BD3|nr:aspartate aminotransferase family protein [Streptomyces sp. MP131-18]ONK14644.1 Putrescine aminotransferase [Streptomyces sp. MP131-18]
MTEPATTATATALKAIRRHLSPRLALLLGMNGQDSLEVRASGAEVTLSDGRSALDFGSYGVALLGHRHPRVVAAVTEQLGRMPSSTRVLANETLPRFASEVVSFVGLAGLTRVWTGLNGTDAVETVLKLARAAGGRSRVIAVEGGFHGKSHGALAVTSSPRFREPLAAVLPPVTHVPATADAAALDAAFAGGDVAAVIVEPVQGEGGVRPLGASLLHELRRRARDAGAFLVSDEIQCGLRRCGPPTLAGELGLEPDAVLLGKGLGGGVMPLSAVVASEELYAPLRDDPFLHTATFAGHPLSAAAGIAAVRAVAEHAADGERVAQRMEAGLATLRERWPEHIAAVRGRGLLWGLEFASTALAGKVFADLGPAGLLVSPCLGRPEVVRLFPPMIATDGEVDRALGILDTTVRGAAAQAAVQVPFRAES